VVRRYRTTFAFQAGYIPALARIVRGLCAVAGRCCQPLAAVAVTVSVSRGPGNGRPGVTRLCAWCENPIPVRVGRDAVCCSVRCRQARHRFLRAVGYADSVAPSRPLRLAYADSPYAGKGAVTDGLDGFRESQILLRRVRGEHLSFRLHAVRRPPRSWLPGHARKRGPGVSPGRYSHYYRANMTGSQHSFS
jgi:hypothetical protein